MSILQEYLLLPPQNRINTTNYFVSDSNFITVSWGDGPTTGQNSRAHASHAGTDMPLLLQTNMRSFTTLAALAAVGASKITFEEAGTQAVVTNCDYPFAP